MISLVLVAAALQVADSARLPLAAAIDRALARYPSVAAAEAVRGRASAEVGEAQASWLPRLSVDASLTRFQEPMVVRPLHGFDPLNPPLFDRTLLQSGVSLSYTLWDFGARSGRVGAARALTSVADASLDGSRAQLVQQVLAAYLRVGSAREVLVAEDQRVAALDREVDRVTQMLAQGKAARVQLLRAEAEREGARAERIGAAAGLDVAEHELALLAELPLDSVHAARLDRMALAAGAETQMVDRSGLLASAGERNPQIREATSRVQAAVAAAGAVRATRFPELRVLGGYVDRGRAFGDFVAEWQGGVQLSYPVFTGGQRGSAIRRAAWDVEIQEQQQRLAKLNLSQAIDRALAAREEARARVVALELATQRSAEVARIERLSLDVGSGTQRDYLDAEAYLLRSRASLIEARHAEILALTELARLAGQLTPAWVAGALERQS